MTIIKQKLVKIILNKDIFNNSSKNKIRVDGICNFAIYTKIDNKIIWIINLILGEDNSFISEKKPNRKIKNIRTAK